MGKESTENSKEWENSSGMDPSVGVVQIKAEERSKHKARSGVDNLITTALFNWL
jgi:hypothetical protein